MSDYYKLYLINNTAEFIILNLAPIKTELTMESNILQSLLSHENATRKRAEESLLAERTSNPANLLNTLIEGMKSSSDQNIA